MIVSPGKNTYTKIDTKRTKRTKKKKKKKKKKKNKKKKNKKKYQNTNVRIPLTLQISLKKNIHRLFLFLQQIKNQKYLPLFPMH